ncbi:MAG: hypothetical protein HFF70_07610 [Oscillospiraceae bacterium]|jgi:uncharacterized membrane protein|nr:hypothetical protein [Oscillospiraceae bacterium]
MTQTNPLADVYLQSIRRLLDAPPEDRDRLMGRLSRAVRAYLEENPEAGAEGLAAAFGSPADCAAELMAECDPARTAAARRKKRRVLYAVIAVLVAALIAMTAVFLYFDAHQIKYVDIYITEDAPDTRGLS